VVGKDDAVYSSWWDANVNNGAWNGWFRIGDPHFGDGFTVNQHSVISAVARQPDHLDLFVIGKDGNVYSSWWDAHANNGRWNGWFRISETAFTAPVPIDDGTALNPVDG
jgi:hypothetical protein